VSPDVPRFVRIGLVVGAVATVSVPFGAGAVLTRPARSRRDARAPIASTTTALA